MQKNNDLNFKRILLIEKIDVKTIRILRLKTLIAIASFSISAYFLYEKKRKEQKLF